MELSFRRPQDYPAAAPRGFSRAANRLSFRAMKPESFARWAIPREIDGIALLGDFEHGPGRSGLREPPRPRRARAAPGDAAARCVFLLGERRIEAERGTLLWVPPRREHTILDPSPDFRRWMLLSRPRLVRRVLPAEPASTFLSRGAAMPDASLLGRTLTVEGAHALARELRRDQPHRPRALHAAQRDHGLSPGACLQRVRERRRAPGVVHAARRGGDRRQAPARRRRRPLARRARACLRHERVAPEQAVPRAGGALAGRVPQPLPARALPRALR